MAEKPVPTPSPTTEAFWEACDDGRFVLQECTECGTVRFYPDDFCPDCWSEEWETVESTGEGTVVSYSVVHRPMTEAFADDVPYVVAIAELDEGARVLANVLDCEPDEVEVGAPVELTWEERGERLLYQFAPADSR